MNENDLWKIIAAAGGGFLLWRVLRPGNAQANETETTVRTQAPSPQPAGIGPGTILRWPREKKPTDYSTFGGPSDKFESANNVAYLPGMQDGETPAQYYARIPESIRYLFDPEMKNNDDMVMVEFVPDWKNPLQQDIREARASYFLNPNARYAAWPMPNEGAKFARAGRAFLAYNNNGRHELVARVIDYGPHPAIAKIDMSYGARAFLQEHGVNPTDIYVVIV